MFDLIVGLTIGGIINLIIAGFCYLFYLDLRNL